MFTCRYCMRRHTQGIIQDLTPYHIGRQRNSTLRYSGAAVTGRYTSAPILVKHHDTQVISRPRAWENVRRTNRKDGNDKNRPLERQEWLQSRGVRPSAKRKVKLQSEFAIKKELTYLGDPLKLALHILSVLRKDKFEEAENLVRAASRQIQCTVSWNHLVEWQLSRGKVNGAIKTYNEMKKRGQAPDAVTFTILFNGLAKHAHYPNTVLNTLNIYKSMFSGNSPVKPNMTHTNAAVKVCARANDMDALFSIVGNLPRRGSRAANNLTFTTILNALRQSAILRIPDGSSPLKQASHETIREKAISDARRMWNDIIDRWSQGDILIDEELVCSMGRVLLSGKKEDLDDIFALVEQTMKIPRPVPRLGSLARDKIDPDLQGKIKESSPKAILEVVNEDEEPSSPVQRDEFRAVNPPAQPKNLSPFARPGCNTLSLVLLALDELKLKRFAVEYWNLFTKTHKVQPDRENYITYLRILRTNRASSETVALILQMPRTMFEKKTFRIAMSACARDKNNQSVLQNASKILDLMQESQSELDLATLNSYLETVMYGRVYHGEGKENEEFSRGRQIFAALQKLDQAFLYINKKLSNSDRVMGAAAKSQVEVYKAEALDLAREMIGAYDKLISRQMVPTEMYNTLAARRSSLAAFVTRYNNGKSAEEVVEATTTSNTREATRYRVDVQKIV